MSGPAVLAVDLNPDVPGGVTVTELVDAVSRLRGVRSVTQPWVDHAARPTSTVDLDTRLSAAQRVLRDGHNDRLSRAVAEARNLLNGVTVPEPRPGIRQGTLPATEVLYFRSMGKALRVTAIFTDTDAANRYMDQHPDDAVVACVGGIIYLANRYDQGVKIDG